MLGINKTINKEILDIRRENMKADINWHNDIVKILDKCLDLGNFPLFLSDWHSIFGRARLMAFRSEEEWLIVIQELSYDNGLGDFFIKIYAFGNKLERQCSQTTAQSWFSIPKTGQDWCPDPLNFKINFRSEQKIFTFSNNDYYHQGIDLAEQISGDECYDKYIYILRMLSSELSPNTLFISQEVVLKIVKRPQDLPLFIQLDEWCHPDQKRIAKPSQSSCLKMLAKALAENNRDSYECPSELINSTWKHRSKFYGSLKK
jgi:hypothetical protein